MKILIDLLVRLFSKPARIEPEPVITNDIVVEKPKPILRQNELLSAVLQPHGHCGNRCIYWPVGRAVRCLSGHRRSLDDCDGHTKGVKAGRYSRRCQCDQLAAEDVAEHNAGIRQCITREMTPNQEIALTSLAFQCRV